MTPILITAGLACLVTSIIGQAELRVEYQWKYLNWKYSEVVATGKSLIFGNSFTIDVDLDRAGRIFVTSPQYADGVPITLSLVTGSQGPGGPLLTPYPDWSWHTLDTCDALISVYRIAIDECNRLWFVDLGRRGSTVLCPMKIMIFDLYTDKLIHKYVIPNDQSLNGKASLVTPIVEVGNTCADAYLYVADITDHGLLIYDLCEDRSWRLNNTRGNAFGSEPDATTITIANEEFDRTDGILGMSLSPRGFFNDRYLYFNSLASFYEKFTDVNSLKMSEQREPLIFQSIMARSSQAGVQATSRRGVIFFPLISLTAVACWNIENPFTPEYIEIIGQDEESLQYVSGIKVVTNNHGEEELWFNTNRLQKIFNKSIRHDEINYRLVRGLVDDLIRDTACERRNFTGPYPEISSWRQI